MLPIGRPSRVLAGAAFAGILLASAPAAGAQTGFAGHGDELVEQLGRALAEQPADYVPRTRHLDEHGRPKFTNRLLLEGSPYLRQHAHNPVDWYPWGEEALAAAAKQDKPIFLSIGYSTCHWCHVMEEESFDNLHIADILNAGFIAIKVDRELRPDLDDIYMTAVQVMGNRGGWPMSSFLTPEGRPFFGATYFPPDLFEDVLASVGRAWRDDRATLLTVADNVVDRVRSLTDARGEAVELGDAAIATAKDRLLEIEDLEHGGFGGAPKFPHESELLFASARALATGDEALAGLVERALEGMARGGIFDQVGGGFHRYATDEAWLVPHFEKMLYNQALLARAYLAGYRMTGRRFFLRVAQQTLDYVVREMTAPEGTFYSATDADSEGEEGLYFLWTPEQLRRALGSDDADSAAALLGVTSAGNFEGRSILHLPRRLDAVAATRGLRTEELLDRVDGLRERLRRARERRIPPLRDDKVITAWNGMMITALAEASGLLGETYLEAARRAADHLWSHGRAADGTLWRIRFGGESSGAGLLEDYACLAEAFLTLYDAGAGTEYLDRALGLLRQTEALFWDPENGGFFTTSRGFDPTLIARPRSPRDDALPSGNAVALRSLAMAARRSEAPAMRALADRLVQSFSGAIVRSPTSFSYLLLGWSQLGPIQTGPRAYGADGRVVVRPRLMPGQPLRLALDVEIAEGWHINSSRPLEAELSPTAVAAAEGSGWLLTVPRFPPGRQLRLPFQDAPLSVYSGTLTLETILRPRAAAPGDGVTVELAIQACDDRACLRPETVALRVPLAPVLRGGAESY